MERCELTHCSRALGGATRDTKPRTFTRALHWPSLLSQTLFTISLENASPTPVTMLPDRGISTALAFYPVDGRLFRVAGFGMSIVFEAIDLTQFIPEEIAFAGIIGSGPPLLEPKDITVLSHGQFVVVDEDSGAVLLVNPSTGDRTIVSSP